MFAMCTLYKRTSKINRIDSSLLKEQENHQAYWREVSKRVVSTIKLLGRLGLGFRGQNEQQQRFRKKGKLIDLLGLPERI